MMPKTMTATIASITIRSIFFFLSTDLDAVGFFLASARLCSRFLIPIASLWTPAIEFASHRKNAPFEQGALYALVPMAGLEPARYRYQRILSPSRLPIPSHRLDDYYNTFVIICQSLCCVFYSFFCNSFNLTNDFLRILRKIDMVLQSYAGKFAKPAENYLHFAEFAKCTLQLLANVL